jgi:hypothetical protein
MAFDNDSPSQLQEQILLAFEQTPNPTAEDIAEQCDCSASYVRETVNEYKDGMDSLI